MLPNDNLIHDDITPKADGKFQGGPFAYSVSANAGNPGVTTEIDGVHQVQPADKPVILYEVDHGPTGVKKAVAFLSEEELRANFNINQ